jgi:hypothetical protein
MPFDLIVRNAEMSSFGDVKSVKNSPETIAVPNATLLDLKN